MIGNPIPEEFKVTDSEVHNLSSFREMYEQRLARLEKKTAQLEQPGVNWIYDTKQEYGGFTIVRDLEYTTYRIYDLQGKEVSGLSEGSFRNLNRAQGQIDMYNALQKAMNKLNGHSTTSNNHTSA
jgi:ribosome-associated translation inhibitor RaiA